MYVEYIHKITVRQCSFFYFYQDDASSVLPLSLAGRKRKATPLKNHAKAKRKKNLNQQGTVGICYKLCKAL